MSIKKGIRNVVIWMAARRKYNNKRHDLHAKMKTCASAEAYADETIGLATKLLKKCEHEMALMRQECAILRKKAETVAKFASELIVSPQETSSRLDDLEHRLSTDLKAIRARLGIAPKGRAEAPSRTLQ